MDLLSAGPYDTAAPDHAAEGPLSSDGGGGLLSGAQADRGCRLRGRTDVPRTRPGVAEVQRGGRLQREAHPHRVQTAGGHDHGHTDGQDGGRNEEEGEGPG
eukprot:1187063-Rhodomonas_salina.2